MIYRAEYVSETDYKEALASYDREGFVIFRNVLTPDELSGLKAALDPHFKYYGRNEFEGHKTQRAYSLLAKHPLFTDLALHPLVIAFAEHYLGQSMQLSTYVAINIAPGESVQPWHYDEGHITAPRPRESWSVSAFWAIDETTQINGATEFIPGSHLWGEETPQNHVQAEHFNSGAASTTDGEEALTIAKATMPAGSLMLAKGTLWHRGGANTSDKSRLIITPQYSVGWTRQLENMLLAVPPEKAAALPKRAQELIGYNIYPPFMGYVDGLHPSRTLPKHCGSERGLTTHTDDL